jgi:hypothetical protein
MALPIMLALPGTSKVVDLPKSRPEKSEALREMTAGDCIQSGFVGSGNYIRSEAAITAIEDGKSVSDDSPIRFWWPKVCRSKLLLDQRAAFSSMSPIILGFRSKSELERLLDRCLSGRGSRSIEEMSIDIRNRIQKGVEGRKSLRLLAMQIESYESGLQLCSNDVLKINPVVNLEIRPAIPGLPVWGVYKPKPPIAPGMIRSS